MLNDNYPAKRRTRKKYKPKEEPQKPHGRILLAYGPRRKPAQDCRDDLAIMK